ncbi:starch phosphorylase [Thermosulfidibacter takaii ABI70S6]|uniref:glycogen phosphorylase n=1 Tax=Thermosulfidibacter takaii (strain DSM 17441 / JCM 13301 / NBRC 103674 / ABI70S6) TaxID=1298851 RepID=A0A0S3QVJ3_THET7|nr:alpha-glucan family phosphorylase [Thermosulfidibacter takaii]BAT72346.1 starch phosphorylase [Thermosulfidibacter takaii ABI70S6]
MKLTPMQKLEELSYNLWWSWNLPARRLFKMIEPILWEEVQENPIELLKKTTRLQERLESQKFLDYLEYVYSQYKCYLSKHSLYDDRFSNPIAFFSPEYGLHHSLLIYAGGLGFLAGDILKESSDMGFPMVAFGFMYPQGYVKQRIRVDGWQEEVEETEKIGFMPTRKVMDEDGNWLKGYVYCRDEKIYFGVWKVEVGKTSLYLLDTNVEENAPWNREISSKLYVADKEIRLRQQMVLGFGGVILLERLGIEPSGFHINEDYPVFALLAKALRYVKHQGYSFEEALQKVRERSLFTTHTPLKAAVNVYPFHMIIEQFSFVSDVYGVDVKKILDLGTNPQNPQEGFNTTIMAIRLANNINAVSKKHCEVSRKMWGFLWEKEEENPITYVTNGVHLLTWTCCDYKDLLTKYLGANWQDNMDDEALWNLIDEIPGEVLWEQHMKFKLTLINHVVDRARKRWSKFRYDPHVLIAQGLLLDENALTIGFARRMTAYKRPDLIFYDVERLKRIVKNAEKPVQIIFAGKAHPADIEGKKLIQRIFNFAKDPDFEGRIAFIEGYDEWLAHYLVAGVDVWLNNPVPPLEASGTSGMKASMNGVLHFSILDGWWPEGYNGENGWAFGDYEVEGDRSAKDAEAIYSILENEIVPLYYDRDEKGIPRGWVRKMKEAIKTISPKFCTRRMMKEYINKFYAKMAGVEL